MLRSKNFLTFNAPLTPSLSPLGEGKSEGNCRVTPLPCLADKQKERKFS
jgi:hypothetical protein